MQKILNHKFLFSITAVLLCFLLCACSITFSEPTEDPPSNTTAPITTTQPLVTTTTAPSDDRSFPVSGRVTLQDAFDWLNIRNGPSTRHPIVARLASGTFVTLIGEDRDFYQIDFFDLQAYVSKDYVQIPDERPAPFDSPLYAHAPHRMITSTDAQRNEVELMDQLVDLRTVDPGIKTNIIFATDKNFTGRVQYPIHICMIQESTAEKLKKAQSLFMEDGYSIIVYDAYRPFSVSVIMFELIRNPIYVADPYNNPSRHNRGAAVDISLIDMSTGKELEMPSKMHTFNATAHRNQANMSSEARKNMNYMTSIMEQVGFTPYIYEWWHFTDTNWASYPATDHNFSEFVFSNHPTR